MSCQKCNSERLLSFMAHCQDRFACEINGVEYHGYVPDWFMPFGDSFRDQVEITMCLDCGQVQGKFPHEKIDIEIDLDTITVEEMLDYCENDCGCCVCNELVKDIKLSTGNSIDSLKKWWFNHKSLGRC